MFECGRCLIICECSHCGVGLQLNFCVGGKTRWSGFRGSRGGAGAKPSPVAGGTRCRVSSCSPRRPGHLHATYSSEISLIYSRRANLFLPPSFITLKRVVVWSLIYNNSVNNWLSKLFGPTMHVFKVHICHLSSYLEAR